MASYGLTGRMLGEDDTSGRLRIQLDDGRPPIQVKPENVSFRTKYTACANCKLEEPEGAKGDDKFKVCARCTRVSY